MAGEFAGRARHLIANFNQEVYTLSGRVEIDSISPEREPIRLRAQRLVYERGDLVVRATGDVRFDQGGSHLTAPTMLFHLTEDERTVRFVSAHEGVEARLVERIGTAIERRLEVSGDELSVVFDPVSGDPVEAEVRAGGGRRARMASVDEASQVRSLLAPVLHARFTGGELSYAEAYGTVHLREYLAFDPSHVLNWGCGERAEVSFAADGSIDEASFYERVEFRNRQALARGDRLDMTGEPYEITMVGEPASVIGAQGGLDAPRIVQQGEGGPVRALGGVRGLFERGQGEAALSLGGGDGPVRLESKEALWDRQGQSFTFLEDVRLWQGENLLLAEEVETETDTEVVVARGGIKTVLVPEEKAEQPPPEASAEDGEGESSLAREPVEVTSEWMEYGIETRRILYHEGVRITQMGRLMQCDEAEAQMLEAGGMEWLECRGGAQVKDNVAGRTVRGEDAFFEVARSEITFTGRPVVMTGEKGERIEGPTLIYDLESGGARIAGPRPPGQDPREEQ
jgi:lipopolysaccharide export system protein LptA